MFSRLAPQRMGSESIPDPTERSRRSRCRRARPGDRTRLRIEPLEQRLLLSTVNWIAGDGDWNTASNWLDNTSLTNHVPASGDDAVIDVTGITVTHGSGDADAVDSLTSKAAIDLSSGQLSLANASSISGPFTLSGGTLSGA